MMSQGSTHGEYIGVDTLPHTQQADTTVLYSYNILLTRFQNVKNISSKQSKFAEKSL